MRWTTHIKMLDTSLAAQHDLATKDEGITRLEIEQDKNKTKEITRAQ